MTTAQGEATSETATTATADAAASEGSDKSAATTSPAEGAATDDKAAAVDAPAKTEDKKPAGPPEAYVKFKVGDKAVDDADQASIEKAARELGLTQETAQKFAEMRAADRASSEAANEKRVSDARAEWVAEISADKKLGGDKLTETLATSKVGLKSVDADGKMQALLNQTGFGDHPEVIKMFHRIGLAMGEAKHEKLTEPGGYSSNEGIANRLFKQTSEST